MKQTFETAREVSEQMLTRTGEAMLSGDFDTILQCFALPQEIQTFDGTRLVETREELCAVFSAVRHHYQKMGVTDIIRHCVEASFSDANTVIATHETRLVSGVLMAQNPFPTLSVLRFNGETWQVASSSYAIEDRADHNAALMYAGSDFSREQNRA